MGKRFLDEHGLETLLTELKTKVVSGVETDNGLNINNGTISISLVSDENNGAMSYEDKAKLDELEDNEPIPEQKIEQLF